MSLPNKSQKSQNYKTFRPWTEETPVDIYNKNINWPKISIITPSYNQGQFIEQTIRSVIEQGYPNLEYIIIDGGSTDNTIEIIKKYEKQITYWVSEADRGQAHAINKGLEKATGDIFNWLNSDDYYEPGTLRHIGQHFAENPNTNVLCGHTHCYYEETGKTSHTYQMGVKKTVADTILNVEMNQPGSFYKLEIVKELAGVNKSLRYVFDDELWFKYLCKYGQKQIAFTDKLMVHFRLHDSSKSVGEGFAEFWKELTAIHYEMAKQLQFPDFLLKAMKKDTLSIEYQTQDWNFSALEKEKYEAWFCNKYQYLFYKDFKYVEAKYCIKKALLYKNKYINLSFLKLIVKLYLIPWWLLKWLRKI